MIVLSINLVPNAKAEISAHFNDSRDVLAGTYDVFILTFEPNRYYSNYLTSDPKSDLICLDATNFQYYETGFVGGQVDEITIIGPLSAINDDAFTKTGYRVHASKTYYFVVENANFCQDGAPEEPIVHITFETTFSSIDTSVNPTKTTNLNLIFFFILFPIVIYVAKKTRKKIAEINN